MLRLPEESNTPITKISETTPSQSRTNYSTNAKIKRESENK